MLNPIKILLFWWSLLFPLSVHLVSCLFHVKERGGGKKKKASLGFNFGLHALVHPVASVQMLVRLLHPAARGEGDAGSLLDWGDPLVSGWKWGWHSPRHAKTSVYVQLPCSHKRSKKLLREHPAHSARCLGCDLRHRRRCRGPWQLPTQAHSSGLSHRVPHLMKRLKYLLHFPGLHHQTERRDCSGCAALHLYEGFLQGKEGSLGFAHGRNRW